MKTLFIYCAGGFGKEVMDVARRVNESVPQWDHIYFLDDVCKEDEKYGAKIFRLDAFPQGFDRSQCEAVIASGEPVVREKLLARLESAGIALGKVIDTTSIVSTTASIDSGVVITPFCSISSHAVLSRNSTVNTTSIIGHDVEIGENTVVSSMVNLGGGCKVGRNSYIGMGALIRERLTIGKDTIIGMGSVVVHDIPDGVIALGNPAKPIRPNIDKKVFK